MPHARKTAVLTLLLAPGFAAAQTDTAAEPDPVSQLAEQITVTATRSPTDVFSFPGQVTVVERPRLEDLNVSGLEDIFDVIPGAQIDGGPRRSGQVPSVRGAQGESVLILIDGARQSFISGHDGRFFLEPELLKSVEIVRGPSSALYGSSAIGGVIALRTVDAEDYLRDGESAAGQFKAGFSSVDDEWRVTGTAALDGGAYNAVAGITFRDSGDIELGNDFALPADSRNFSGMVKLGSDAFDDIEISGSWIFYRDDAIDPANPQAANLADADNPEVDRDISSDTFQGRLGWNPESKLIDLAGVVYFTSNEVEEDETQSPRVVSREVNTVGFTIDNRSRFEFGNAAAITLTYGGEYYRDKQTGEDNQSVDGSRGGVPDATARFLGAFVQADASTTLGGALPGTFRLIPALRFDSFRNRADGSNSINESAFSPKISASFESNNGVLIFGSYSQAFRAPSFNEIFADGVHFRVPDLTAFPPRFVANEFIENPDLQPEESETFEIGGGYEREDLFAEGDRLTLKGSYYWSDVSNLIDLDVFVPATCFGAPFGPPCITGGTSQNVNTRNADLSGFEIEAVYDSRYFTLRANASGINGEDKATGEPVGVLYPNRLFIDAMLKAPQAELRGGVRATLADGFEETPTAAQSRDGYTVIDLYAIWEPSETFGGAFDGLRLDLGVENLFDRDYEVVNAGVSQPGRDFRATLSYRVGF